MSRGMLRAMGGVACVVVCWAASLAGAAIVYVDGTLGDDNWNGAAPTWQGGDIGPKATILGGISVTQPYDIVTVADGVYRGSGNTDLSLLGRSITVRATHGPQNCIIDCEYLGPAAFSLQSDEAPDALILGFGIQRATVAIYMGTFAPVTVADCVIHDCFGFGIICYAYGGFIRDCTLSHCQAGGVYCANYCSIVNCTITDCADYGIFGEPAEILDCVISGNQGDGVLCQSPPSDFARCTITRNSGSGIAANSDLNVHDCLITDNGGPGVQGGGVRCAGQLTLVNCTLTGNSASWGGSLYLLGGGVIDRCRILGNYALGLPIEEGHGGALFMPWAEGQLTIANSLLAQNVAVNAGGGLWIATQPDPPEANFELSLINCTIADNAALFNGGGLWFAGESDDFVFARNTILWDNSAALGPVAYIAGAPNWRIACCDLPAGEDVFHLEGDANMTWGLGNRNEPPLFLFPDGADYQLTPGSACIDAGENLSVVGDLDLIQNMRRYDDPNTPDTGFGGIPVVDMGAFEFGSHPQPPQVFPGDLNCDDVVDFDDINPFVLALSDPDGYELAYPGCNRSNADCNSDGAIDFTDINAFIALLGGGN